RRSEAPYGWLARLWPLELPPVGVFATKIHVLPNTLWRRRRLFFYDLSRLACLFFEFRPNGLDLFALQNSVTQKFFFKRLNRTRFIGDQVRTRCRRVSVQPRDPILRENWLSGFTDVVEIPFDR